MHREKKFSITENGNRNRIHSLVTLVASGINWLIEERKKCKKLY
jgi:hypothetical protein